MIKPAGSDCNLDCTYCFYKNRPAQIGIGRQRMSIPLLEKMTNDYLSLQLPVSTFSWQGGEPMLMGLDFYKKAIELQNKFKTDSRIIYNNIQTNAVQLDEDWCIFLHDNNFLVGISIDGPEELHNTYRKNTAGRGSFDLVLKAIKLCQAYQVEFNAIVVLNNHNADQPDLLIDYLYNLGIKYLQFIPCVEINAGNGKVASFSVTPQQYGNFLCRAFDRWLEIGPLNISIRDFESFLSFLVVKNHSICTYQTRCGDYIVIEHNGDCFPCDFYVKPDYKLGNILEETIEQITTCEKNSFLKGKKKSFLQNALFADTLISAAEAALKIKFLPIIT